MNTAATVSVIRGFGFLAIVAAIRLLGQGVDDRAVGLYGFALSLWGRSLGWQGLWTWRCRGGLGAIGQLLDQQPLPPDPAFGESTPAQVAAIAENICIGCAACLQACPVDAILGAPHYMHTIIASECTGCELCVASCPVDCISMEPK